MPAVWNAQANSIFLQALEQLAAKRESFVRRACGGDAALSEQVRSLLAASERVGDFLESPATDVANLADTAREKGVELPSLAFLLPSERPESMGRLGHYEVLGIVGEGGMGVVVKAFDEKLQRIVAIKTLAQSLAASATARKRFIREAQAAAAVKHDNVISIYAVEQDGPVPYLVMELVAGISLEEKLQQEGPLQVREILRIGLQIAEGLSAAHRQGLVHRDVKPANILLENGVERVKITDFGLARAVNDANLTQAGIISGTPQYMSPEQAQGLPLDARSDLFSLGCVLYAMCTGRPPFRSDTAVAALRRICDDTPPPIRELNPEISEWLVAVIDRLLAKKPDERIQTAAEVSDILGRGLAEMQNLSAVGEAFHLPAPPQAACQPAHMHARWTLAAAVLVCVGLGLGLVEATGTTRFTASVIHIFSPSGTLVVETDDAAVKVTIEGDGGLSITGAGPQEVHLRPGKYRLLAIDDGQLLSETLVEISRGDRKVVTVKRAATAQAASPPPGLAMPLGQTTSLADWDQNIAAFSRARELFPNNAQLWYYHAVACLAAGKEDEYRRVCAAMMERFGLTHDRSVAAHVLYTCLTRPDVVPDSKLLVHLGELVGHDHRVLTAALYRDGRFDEVVARLPRLKAEDDLWLSHFLAMAYHRLGRTEEARAVLDAAFVERLKRYPEGTNPVSENWNSRVQQELLWKEADELMTNRPEASNQQSNRACTSD